MNTSTNIRRGVAAGIAGTGLALGGLGIASATEDGTQSGSSTPAASSATDAGSAERGQGDRGRGQGRGHRLGGPDLAEALGVSEAELHASLESVREQLEPSQTEDRSARPTDGELDERRGQTIDALAEELDLSAADVTAAFEELQQGRADERRTSLGDRLDEAVSEGELTAEDRACVLKAFDAGVLGGGPGGDRGAR